MNNLERENKLNAIRLQISKAAAAFADLGQALTKAQQELAEFSQEMLPFAEKQDEGAKDA